MKIFYDLSQWQQARNLINPMVSIGFIPTMGNLHKGHASLFTNSLNENKVTIASIFVNPMQFNQLNDFVHYPRTLEADITLLEQLGVDYCLIPKPEAVYPPHLHYKIEESELSLLMEGTQRPGHFNGVLTVVMKLFNLVRPTIAYFGEKDFQQYLLIKQMVDAFFLNITIQACPTIREDSGLAYSSRNSRLTSEEKKLAEQFARIFHQAITCDAIINQLKELSINVNYLLDYQERRYAAISIGDIRLIDNYRIF